MAQDLALIAAYEERLRGDLGVEHPVALAARHALDAARGAIIDLSASQEPSATEALNVVASELAHRHGVEVDVEAGSEHLVGEQREAVVRIAREAIVNAIQHGGAQNIMVTLRTNANQLMLTIDDDGCGFGRPGSRAPRDGYGFREMTGWADTIGGHLTTQQGTHGGSAVKVIVS
jgi:signal transduction histidine kinase